MNEQKSWSFLHEMTKDEIVSYLNQQCWLMAPTMEQVQFYIYDRRMGYLLKEQRKWMDKNHPKMRAIAQGIDSLGAEYNKLNDDLVENRFEKQLKILNQRSKLYNRLSILRREESVYGKKLEAVEKAFSKYKGAHNVN